MSPLSVERVIDIFVRDRNGQPIPGAEIAFSINGSASGFVENAEGRGRIELPIRKARVSVAATYQGTTKTADLAENQDTFTFTFDVNVGKAGMDFLERHIALMIGIVLIAVAIALAFVFGTPSTLQTRIILGTFSLAAGAIASEIPGMLNINVTLGTRVTIAAAGALGVFVLLYLCGPGK